MSSHRRNETRPHSRSRRSHPKDKPDKRDQSPERIVVESSREESDEELARRLQQEENEAANHRHLSPPRRRHFGGLPPGLGFPSPFPAPFVPNLDLLRLSLADREFGPEDYNELLALDEAIAPRGTRPIIHRCFQIRD